jgi:hypothetical protein
MRNRLGLAALAMAIGAVLAGDAAVAQPAGQMPAPAERPKPDDAIQLTGKGGVGLPPGAATADSVDIEDHPIVASRSYRMTCQVPVGSCSIAADGPGQSCYCEAAGDPGRYWGKTR